MTATDPGTDPGTDRTAIVRLAASDVVCEIAPFLGGSILRLSLDGIDLLRPAGEDADDVLATASFPLVPFANRIAHGGLNFDGIAARLDPDPLGTPHALHGHGWRADWQLASVGPATAVLAFEHHGQGWPWPYRATQTFRLLESGLAIEIAIENLDSVRAMPAGAGIHPYFRREEKSAILGRAARSWLTDADALAIQEVDDPRFASGNPVRVSELEGTDTFFHAPGEPVLVLGSGPPVRIDGDRVEGFHIYVPTDGDFFCVEPVSHAPNAFGRGIFGPHDVIPPGGRRHWNFNIAAE